MKPRMKPKISLITLSVRDLPRALAFYRDGLGFPTHNFKAGEDFAMFRLEGTWLALYPRDAMAAEIETSAGEGGGFEGIMLAHNAGSKAEVDQVFELALAAGATEKVRPKDVFWGGYSGYFADPDGHVWEVAWNPFTDLT